MLLLIAALVVGMLLFCRNLRLEGASDVRAYVEEKPAAPVVRAYVDGKPVKSYLKE